MQSFGQGTFKLNNHALRFVHYGKICVQIVGIEEHFLLLFFLKPH
jgi:hypothetical protein